MDPRRGRWMHGSLDAPLRVLWRAVVAAWSVRLVRLMALGVVLVLAALSTYLRFHTQGVGPCDADYSSYYRSALALRHGTSPYGPLADAIRRGTSDPFTSTSCVAGILEFSYTPFFGVLLIPITWLPYRLGLTLWDASLLVFLGGAIFAFLRAARVRPTPYLVLLLAGTAVLTSALRFELFWAQGDLFLVFFICAALWARTAGRATLAGLLLAVACASEPALLAFVAVLLWKREIKWTAVTLASSTMLIFTPFLWLGSKALLDLLVIWRWYWGAYAVTFTNDAPLGILLRLFTPNQYEKPLVDAPMLAVGFWLLMALAAAAAAAAQITRRPLGSDTRSLLDIGLAVVTLLLVSPWSENGLFTLLLVPFLAVWVCLRRMGWQTPAGRTLYWGFALALVLALALGDPLQFALMSHMGRGSLLTYVSVIFAATYLYQLLAIGAVVVYAQRALPSQNGRSSPTDRPAQKPISRESHMHQMLCAQPHGP